MKKKIFILIIILALLINTSCVGKIVGNNNNENDIANNNNNINITNDENNINNNSKNSVNDSNETDEIEETSGDNRSDIKEEYKWDLTKIYETTDDFNKDINLVKDAITKLNELNDDFLDSSDNFTLAIKTYIDNYLLIDKLNVYVTLAQDIDLENNEKKHNEEIVTELISDFSQAASFIEPKISNMDENKLNDFLKNKDLDEYKIYIEDIIDNKEHILSVEGESLLSKAIVLDDSFENIYNSYYYRVDLSEVLEEPDFSAFWTSTEEEKEKMFNDLYKKTKLNNELLSEIYLNEIKKNEFFAKSKNYTNTLEQALYEDGYPLELYENMYELTHENLNLLHRWISLKKNILQIDKYSDIHAYDPLVNADYDYFTYEQAMDLAKEALKPLGKDYLKKLDYMFNNKLIDVFPSDNKYEGGYQYGAYNTDSFVLLNFEGYLEDVSTLVHESGHAINSIYTNKNTSYLESNIPIFLAEIASTTNESLLYEYLIKNSEGGKKAKYIIDYLTLIENTVFNQLILGEFEDIVYKAYENGEALNTDFFNETMENLYKTYYGKDYKVLDFKKYYWSEMPHFYSAFYVYKYATGLACGLNFSDNILNGDKSDLEKYFHFLSAGSTDEPLTILKDSGVDFKDNAPIKLTFKKFESLLNELEEIIGN